GSRPDHAIEAALGAVRHPLRFLTKFPRAGWPHRFLAPILAAMDLYVHEIGLLDDDEIELDLAALELSRLDHEGIDPEPYHALLEEIAARLNEVGHAARSPAARGEALARVLHGDFGFTGDAENYDAPLNTDM